MRGLKTYSALLKEMNKSDLDDIYFAPYITSVGFGQIMKKQPQKSGIFSAETNRYFAKVLVKITIKHGEEIMDGV